MRSAYSRHSMRTGHVEQMIFALRSRARRASFGSTWAGGKKSPASSPRHAARHCHPYSQVSVATARAGSADPSFRTLTWLFVQRRTRDGGWFRLGGLVHKIGTSRQARALVGLGLHPQDEALDRPDPDAGAL